jgi:hypothetical protein
MTWTDEDTWYDRIDTAGAVYGSLLAASVVVGQSPLQESVRPRDLALVLLTTGAVFWITHVYARSLAHAVDGRIDRTSLLHSARQESPILLAAVPPAAAALVASAFGLSHSAAAWWAFVTALVGQVGWAVAATRQAGASLRVTVIWVAVNLVLGVALIVLKVAVSH